jgi:flagellar basal body-associated protein FliL
MRINREDELKEGEEQAGQIGLTLIIIASGCAVLSIAIAITAFFWLLKALD